MERKSWEGNLRPGMSLKRAVVGLMMGERSQGAGRGVYMESR